MSKDLSLPEIEKQFISAGRKVMAYKGIAFFLILGLLYGFIIWRINVLSAAPPSQTDIDSAEQSAASPRISESIVKKLETLQDTNQRVQTLFNEARDNPFREQ